MSAAVVAAVLSAHAPGAYGQTAACDRACLGALAEQYLDALVAKESMIAELFKVENGRIQDIEAVFEPVRYGMISDWSSWEEGMSDRIQWER